MMHKLSPFAINFYYGAFAVVAGIIMLAVSPSLTGKPIQTFSYTPMQYAFAILTSVLNFIFMILNTVAMQNEKSGLLSLLFYISLVYAFIGDTFIFNSFLVQQEVIGIAIILTLCIALIMKKISKEKEASP